MVRSYDPLDILALPVPEGLYAITVFPDVVVKTEASRKLLPEKMCKKVPSAYVTLLQCSGHNFLPPNRKSIIFGYSES